MIYKPHYSKINEPIRISLVVFEINFIELALVSGSLFVIMVVFGFVNIYLNLFGMSFFLALAGLYVPLLWVLNHANRQDHPDFLISYISYRFFQPKHITFYTPQPAPYGF